MWHRAGLSKSQFTLANGADMTLYSIPMDRIMWIAAHEPKDMDRYVDYHNCIRVDIDHFYVQQSPPGTKQNFISLHPKVDWYPTFVYDVYCDRPFPEEAYLIMSTEPMFRTYAVVGNCVNPLKLKLELA